MGECWLHVASIFPISSQRSRQRWFAVCLGKYICVTSSRGALFGDFISSISRFVEARVCNVANICFAILVGFGYVCECVFVRIAHVSDNVMIAKGGNVNGCLFA